MTIARTIEIIRRNAFEEADGNSLGCEGPTHVMLKNADAMELVSYAEQLKAKALFVVGILECEGLPKVAEQLRQAVEGEKCVHETRKKCATCGQFTTMAGVPAELICSCVHQSRKKSEGEA